jgi:hypothetical protein
MLHLLKDDAANWAQPHLQKVLNHRRGAITTVDEFIDKFGSAFDNPDAGRAAERKILELTQDSTTTKSMAEYTTEFRNLMADLDWDDPALIASYRRGLHWKVGNSCPKERPNPGTWRDGSQRPPKSITSAVKMRPVTHHVQVPPPRK